MRIAGLVIGAAALLFALMPYAVATNAYVSSPRVWCGPAAVEVTHTPPKTGGWYGYAPLTSTPINPSSCYPPARHRLVLSAIGLFLAMLLGWWSAHLDRGDDRFRRRRWRPRPA